MSDTIIIDRRIRVALNNGDLATVIARSVADASDEQLVEAVEMLSDEDRESLAWAVRTVDERECGPTPA